MSFLRLSLVALAAVAALVVPGTAVAGSVHLEQHIAPQGSIQVTFVVRKPASFNVLLRTRTIGRTQLFLLGKHAPKGGPLMDTANTACDGAAGSYYCQGAYEPLPPGTYTFRVKRPTGGGTNIELTIRW
jgi:hypothetical protein